MTFIVDYGHEAEPSALLNLFSNAALKKIAQTLDLRIADGAPKAGEVVRTALLNLLGTPQHRAALDRLLSREDWDLLNILPLRDGPITLRLLALKLSEHGLAGQVILDRLERLLTCGCLLPLQTAWGQTRLGIDQNSISGAALNLHWKAAPSIIEWAREHATRFGLPQPVEPPAGVAGSALSDLQRVVFVLLAELGRRPLRFTAQGMPYKTDLPRLAAALQGHDGRGAKRRANALDVPPLLHFALSALAEAAVLTGDGPELHPSPEAGRFFSLPAEQQAQTLLAGWCESNFNDLMRIPTLNFGYTPDSAMPWLQELNYYGIGPSQIGNARDFVCLAITEMVAPAPDAWYSVADLARFAYTQNPEFLFSRLHEYGPQFGFANLGYRSASAAKPPRHAYPGIYRKLDQPAGGSLQEPRDRQLYQDSDWPEVEGAFVRQVLCDALRWLGLVEVGPDAGLPDRFRLTALGQHLLLGKALEQAEPVHAGRAAIVQPNFEIVVTDALRNFELLAQLDAFAQRRGLDRAATYQLTQAALVHGLDDGWTGEQIRKALETANDGPLPQNVRYTLEEWIHLYESLSLREAATLLEADDPQQLDRWMADHELSTLLGSRLGPSIALVPDGNGDRVLARITQLAGRVQQVDYAQSPEKVLKITAPDVIEIKAGKSEPYLLYRLQAFTEPLQEPARARCYRITRESVKRAAEAGWQGGQLAHFLAIASGQDLSDDLLLRLLGWSGAIQPLQTENLVGVALATNPAGWEVLMRLPEIARFIRSVPAPELALVSATDLAALRAELEVRGLSLRERTIDASCFKSEASDLRSVLARHRDDPEGVYAALKAAGLVGKLDRVRWG